MTLIVAHAGPTHGYLMTDSAAYNGTTGRHIELTADKLTLLPEINAATMAAGSFPAGEVWRKVAGRLAGKVNGFDRWADIAPKAIRYAVGLAAERVPHNCDLDVYAVGYSSRHGRPEAYLFAYDDGYRPTDITGEMHVRPVPPGVKPTAVELRRPDCNPPSADEPAAVPATDAEWVALAKRVHETRACAHVESGMKMWIAGDVTLATVTADGADKRVIHTFTRDDFRRMVVGTFHPYGQVGPCVCGSGRRYLDCHIPKWRKLPCLCESGKTLGGCCALDAGEARDVLDEHPELRDLAAVDVPQRPAKPKPAAPAPKVGRNDPCPCGSGKKAKKCACDTVTV